MNQPSVAGISDLINQQLDSQFERIEAQARERVDRRISELESFESESRQRLEQQIGLADKQAKAISREIESNFYEMNRSFRARIDDSLAALNAYEKAAIEKIDVRTREVEERVTRDVRTRVFAIATTVVVLAAGAMLVGSFSATREVNNSVIGLQKDIIAAQTSIRTSSDALLEQKARLAEAQVQLKAAMADLVETKETLRTSNAQLEKARAQLDTISTSLQAAGAEARR